VIGTSKGPTLVDGHPQADTIRAEFRDILLPLGKLLEKRRPEEVAEYDGLNGAPMFVTIDVDVFDITGA
jgi:hypothetical protein